MLYYGPVEMVAIMAIAAVATSFQVALPSAKQADWLSKHPAPKQRKSFDLLF